MTAQALAEVARDTFRACGTIQFWGSHMVRPSDEIFSIADVQASGHSLVLTLRSGEERMELAAENVKDCGLNNGELTVGTASRIRWLGDDYAPPPNAGAPALLLR